MVYFSGSEFQKYALGSLQQLLADHPPAPEGLDPDTGTLQVFTHKMLSFHPAALQEQNDAGRRTHMFF